MAIDTERETLTPTEIADKVELDLAFRRLADARSAIAENEQTAAALIKRETEKQRHWVEEENSSRRREAAYWEATIAAYLHRWIEEHPRGEKHVSTANGTVSARALPPEMSHDKKVLIEWAKGHAPEYVRVTEVESLDWHGMKQAAKLRDGGLWLGDKLLPVEVEERKDSITIEVS